MTRLKVGNIRHPDGTDDNINLDSSGRVGVGTSSPDQTLSVGSGAADTRMSINGTGQYQLKFTNSGANGFWIGSPGANSLAFAQDDGATRMTIDSSGNLKFNSGYGSVATAYGCRAWCNADLTGSGSIRDSGNVSSLTDRGTGRWQFHFATAMPDTNYAAIGMQKPNADVVNETGLHPNAPWDTYTTGTVGFLFTSNSVGLIDPLIANIAVFR